MATFIGEYTVKIDDKGRLVFPSPLRSLAGEMEVPMRFVLKKHLFLPCLEMFTYQEWEKQSQEVKARLNPSFNREHDALWRAYMSNRAIVEPDENNSRMLIPKLLLEQISVTKEVVFSGCDYKIEIWSKEQYQAHQISREDFLELAHKYLS